MQTTGNNLNAGSTTADPALATSTNGSWDITANRFIAAGGATPFLSVTVGMYASIYLDAATSAVFVSKITAVDVGGTYIEVSKTANKLGTAPTAGATGRSCKVGGAWAGVPIVSLFVAVTVDQSTRINIKAGSYSITAASAFNTAGTTALPVWFRGYNTTPGDLDDYSSLTKPAWTCTGSGRITFGGGFNIVSGLDITAAVSNNAVSISGLRVNVHRCRITNTTANASSSAVGVQNNQILLSCCFLSSTSSAPVVLATGGNVMPNMFGCIVTGGGNGVTSSVTTAAWSITRCVFRAIGSEGLNFTAITGATNGIGVVDSCTFYGCGSHAIEFANLPTGFIQITNCNFWSITGYGINSSAGTTFCVFRAGNDFRSCSAGDENGLGDTPGNPGTSGSTWGSQDETLDPWTSTTDMTPRIYSKAHQMALPRTFEYEPYNTYADVGAVTSQNTPIPTVGGHVARRT